MKGFRSRASAKRSADVAADVCGRSGARRSIRAHRKTTSASGGVHPRRGKPGGSPILEVIFRWALSTIPCIHPTFRAPGQGPQRPQVGHACPHLLHPEAVGDGPEGQVLTVYCRLSISACFQACSGRLRPGHLLAEQARLSWLGSALGLLSLGRGEVATPSPFLFPAR
jgi:hypothetical protein